MKKELLRIKDLSAGLWTNKDPSQIPDNAVCDCLNTIFDGDFIVEKRKGAIQWNVSAISETPVFIFPYKKGGTMHVMVGLKGADQDLYDYNLLGKTGAAIKTGLNVDGYLTAVNAISACYITNGVDPIMRYDGTNLENAGLPVPASAPDGDGFDTGGNVPTGTYYYKITFVYDIYGESGGSPASLPFGIANPPNSKIKLKTIPTSSSPNCTKRRVYRSTSATTGFLLVGTINDNTTTTFSDDSAAGTDPMPETYTMPVVDYLLWTQSRLFLAESVTNCLYFSDILKPDSVPTLNHIYINKDDGDIITGIAEVGGVIVIFKKRAIWVISGNSPDVWAVRNISREIGCIHHGTIAYADQKIIFVSEKGIYSFDGIRLNFISEAINDAITERLRKGYGLDNFILWDTESDFVNARILGTADGTKINNVNVPTANPPASDPTLQESAVSASLASGELKIDPLKLEQTTDADWLAGTKVNITTGNFWANNNEYISGSFCVDPRSGNLVDSGFETQTPTTGWVTQNACNGQYSAPLLSAFYGVYNYKSTLFSPHSGLKQAICNIESTGNLGNFLFKAEYYRSGTWVGEEWIEAYCSNTGWKQMTLNPAAHGVKKGQAMQLVFYCGDKMTSPDFYAHIKTPNDKEFIYDGTEFTFWYAVTFFQGVGNAEQVVVQIDDIEGGRADYFYAASWLSPKFSIAPENTSNKQWRKIKVSLTLPTNTDFHVYVQATDNLNDPWNQNSAQDLVKQTSAPDGTWEANLTIKPTPYIQFKIYLNETGAGTPTLLTPVIHDITIYYLKTDRNFWISQICDCSNAITAWGDFRVTGEGTITDTNKYKFWLRTAADKNTILSAVWTAQTANAAIALGSVARYVQFLLQEIPQITSVPPAPPYDNTDTPSVYDVFINFYVANENKISPPCAIVYDKRYWLVITEISAGNTLENNVIYVFSLKNGSWTKFGFTGGLDSIFSLCLAETHFLACREFATARTIYRLWQGVKDPAMEINSYFQTKDFGFVETEQLKQLRKIFITAKGDNNRHYSFFPSFNVSPILDGIAAAGQIVPFTKKNSLERFVLSQPSSMQARILALNIGNYSLYDTIGIKEIVMETWKYKER